MIDTNLSALRTFIDSIMVREGITIRDWDVVLPTNFKMFDYITCHPNAILPSPEVLLEHSLPAELPVIITGHLLKREPKWVLDVLQMALTETLQLSVYHAMDTVTPITDGFYFNHVVFENKESIPWVQYVPPIVTPLKIYVQGELTLYTGYNDMIVVDEATNSGLIVSPTDQSIDDKIQELENKRISTPRTLKQRLHHLLEGIRS